MRNLTYILTLSFLIYSCSDSRKNRQELKEQKTDSVFKDTITSSNAINNNQAICDLNIDTIKNEKYRMHIFILNVLLKKEPRNLLYDQDINVFMVNLDPTEKGVYKQLTNKVTFTLLEKGTKYITEYFCVLDRYLLVDSVPKDSFYILLHNHYSYFFEHLRKPTCNTLTSDSIISLLKKNIETPSKFNNCLPKQKANILIEQLNTTTR